MSKDKIIDGQSEPTVIPSLRYGTPVVVKFTRVSKIFHFYTIWVTFLFDIKATQKRCVNDLEKVPIQLFSNTNVGLKNSHGINFEPSVKII